MQSNPILELKLSVQQALVGAITANWAAVTCGLRDRTILLRAYFFGEVTDQDRENLSVVGTEIIADFPEDYAIEESCLSFQDHPLEIFDFWAFMRAEVETSDNGDAITIHVRLLNEGTEVWRPTKAITLGNGLFKLLPTPEYDPRDEEWEFPPGSIVRCKKQKGQHRGILVCHEYLTPDEPPENTERAQRRKKLGGRPGSER